MRKNDFILVGCLLVAALILFAVIKPSDVCGSAAVVYVNGTEVSRYPLDTNGSYVLNNGTNTLVIENRKAYVTDSLCPDKLCEKQGMIYYENQSIVCLPNRLTVMIEGGEGNFDVII